jgi:hypothetical protein
MRRSLALHQSTIFEKVRRVRAEVQGAVAVVIVNTGAEAVSFSHDDQFEQPGRFGRYSADITIPVICVGQTEGERLLLHM